MHIRFTYHANYRREERNISVDKIKETILFPDSISIKPSGKILHTKKFPEKTLTVVYEMSRKIYIIITIY